METIKIKTDKDEVIIPFSVDDDEMEFLELDNLEKTQEFDLELLGDKGE